MRTWEEAKAQGNAAYGEGKLPLAIACFTQVRCMYACMYCDTMSVCRSRSVSIGRCQSIGTPIPTYVSVD